MVPYFLLAERSRLEKYFLVEKYASKLGQKLKGTYTDVDHQNS